MITFKYNPLTGNLDVQPDLVPNKIIYNDENILILTNQILSLIDICLEGTSTITVDGTGILEAR